MVEVEMAQGVREFPKYDPGLGYVASEFSVGPSFITFCSQSSLRIGLKRSSALVKFRLMGVEMTPCQYPRRTRNNWGIFHESCIFEIELMK